MGFYLHDSVELISEESIMLEKVFEAHILKLKLNNHTFVVLKGRLSFLSEKLFRS